MAEEARIRRFVERALEAGQSADEACAAEPELRDAVARGLRRVRRLESELDGLFPTPPPEGASVAAAAAGSRPAIPGYEVLSELGRGGMGVVCRARHLALGRVVALKMLLAGGFATRKEVARFLHEARAAAALRSPNIVEVYDVGEVGGLPFYTMELVEGGSLAQALAGTPQGSADAAALAATLARAVQVAHDGGIVHRDLKPANILFAAGGVPKIADFGIARALEGEPSMTATGERIGTPSYMAPERAAGRAVAASPALDIYALGAILYELVTGRPPFRADTAEETLKQVVGEEPAPPSRINSRVARDLETICLVCLDKDPRRRYASAAALAEDLERFRRGEPVLARRAGALERGWKWIRRHPARTAVIAASVVAASSLLIAAAWLNLSERALAALAEDDLRAVAGHQRRSEWGEARTALERANARFAGSAPAAMGTRLREAARQLELVARIESIRANRGIDTPGRPELYLGWREADRAYEAAFREGGLAEAGGEIEPAAARLRASPIADALVAALDDWAVVAWGLHDASRERWILALARGADPDAGGWRDHARDPEELADPEKLRRLAQETPSPMPPVAVMLAVAERLGETSFDAIGFLKRVQREHPCDFWANFRLGIVLARRRPAEAVRYFQAAVAIRPAVTAGYLNLGGALAASGEVKEGLAVLRAAIAMDPASAVARDNLGNALMLDGQDAEAEAAYRESIRLDPARPGARANLGRLLAKRGRSEEALAVFRELLALAPESAGAHEGAGFVHLGEGRHAEAAAGFSRAVELDPRSPTAHSNLGVALARLGRLSESLPHFERALELEPAEAQIRQDYANALRAAGRLRDALREQREAVRLEADGAQRHLGLGIVLGEIGRMEEAAAAFRRAIELEPASAGAHGGLSEALRSLGRFAEAKAAAHEYLARAPEPPATRGIGTAMMERLDRCLALEARLPAALSEDGDGLGAATLRELAELCRMNRRYLAAVRLAERALDGELTDGQRMHARLTTAAAACRAAAGEGRDDADLDASARAALLVRARELLRENLCWWSEGLEASDPKERSALAARLRSWNDLDDFEALRAGATLALLSAQEREECALFWREVASLASRAASP